MRSVVLCIFLAISTKAAVVPTVTPCLWSDSACILSSAKKAMPYFIEGVKDADIPPVDPVFFEEVIADTGDLKLKVVNLKVVGLSKAELIKIERNNDKSTVDVIIDTPITATGTYTAGGKVLFIDVEGHGDLELGSNKVRLFLEVKLKKIDKDGKTYYTFDGYDFKYDVLDEFFFKFDNLFNGDKSKAEPVLAVVKENWRVLLAEIGGPVIRNIADVALNSVQKFFESIPINEIELTA